MALLDPGASRSADQAHLESTPDLTRSQFAPAGPDPNALPAAAITSAVTARYGSAYRPMVLTVDERLFAFEDWYVYIGAGPGASPALDMWHERAAFIRDLAGISDPAQFADSVVHNQFGPIDVFILRWDTDSEGNRTGKLVWRAGDQATFSPSQFGPGTFDRVDLPDNYVMFIRDRY